MKLNDGLYFVHQFYNRDSAFPDTTKTAVFLTGDKPPYDLGGYFCIKMNMTTFRVRGNTMQISKNTIGLLCMFRNGSKYWNGTAWSDSEATFYLYYDDNGRLRTNKTSDMEVEGDDGYFIPFASDSDDDISLVIYDVAGYPASVDAFRNYETYASIISDISIGVQYTSDNYTASKRNSNVYMLTGISTGFRGDKSISISIGTNNNNMPGPSLIKDLNGDYVEEVGYNSMSGSPYPALSERPERHLIYRMRRQCGGLRRTVSMQIQNVRLAGIDAMAQRWVIDGHAYFGVLSDRNWRDDTDTLKFIEVL